MLFNSLGFFLFLVIVLFLRYLLPPRFRWMVLLGGSYFFYSMWTPWHSIILLGCTIVTWRGAICLSSIRPDSYRKAVLFILVAINLTPLLFFKYSNFLTDILQNLFESNGHTYPIHHLEILLPVGLSFYTFQAMSYCFDTYNRRLIPERHAGVFALYMAFFPKLICGPIERGKNLLGQLKSLNKFNYPMFAAGVQLFFWGLFKKIVIADRLDMYVDMVFGQPQLYWGKTVILASWLFTLQIYCDFSAYTDMAIGCGQMFGIQLSQNFNFPYMANSVADFWRRWHITLTSWFRDYVYIPLGGNRISSPQFTMNILIVFLLSGLWHGAAWTFVFWGGLHGFLYLIGKKTASYRMRLRELCGIQGKVALGLQIFITFNLISLAWVFFRSSSIENAFCLISHMFSNISLPVQMMGLTFSTYLAFGCGILFICMELLRYWDAKKEYRFWNAIPNSAKLLVYLGGLLTMSLLGLSNKHFIYFYF